MKYIKIILYFIIKNTYPIFYNKKYISGKHFEKNGEGWKWILKGIWFQKFLGFNRMVPWPMAPTMRISNYKNIVFDLSSINNFQSPGCYMQNLDAKIFIGKNVYIGPNVGIITSNHDLYNLNNHIKGKNIIIAHNCWIGMNSVILPGVKIGPNTIIGAGSIVTKSFRSGYVVLAGSPAKIVKYIKKGS